MRELTDEIPNVAILLESPYPTHSQILRGILRFTQLHTPWTLDVRMGRAGEPSGFDEVTWNYSGVIANRAPESLAALISRHKTPLVVMNDIARELHPAGRILCDNAAVARIAADTLENAGFTNFAFVGERSSIMWSVERERVFSEEIRRRGHKCHVYRTDSGDTLRDLRSLQDWLASLPRPTALFAACDLRARHVLDACNAKGLRVPDDIAILGVDNDEVICETALPTLSSIPLTAEDVGYQAAEVLNMAMTGELRGKAKPVDVFFTGTTAVLRRSTERELVEDELVRRCRTLIEANITRSFNVSDLVHSLKVSRRTLETRFRAAMGRSLNDEITALRIRHAKTLLSKTSMTQAQIAAKCGFCDASHMSVIFQRHCHARPSTFR